MKLTSSQQHALLMALRPGLFYHPSGSWRSRLMFESGGEFSASAQTVLRLEALGLVAPLPTTKKPFHELILTDAGRTQAAALLDGGAA